MSEKKERREMYEVRKDHSLMNYSVGTDTYTIGDKTMNTEVRESKSSHLNDITESHTSACHQVSCVVLAFEVFLKDFLDDSLHLPRQEGAIWLQLVGVFILYQWIQVT